MSKSRFAHLFPFAKAKATDDEEEKKNHQALEDDEEKEEEELEDGEEKKETDAENTDEDGEEEKAEEEESPEARKARKAENKRCAAIFASPHAANNVGLAAHFAFETRMSAKEAISALALASSGTYASKVTTLDQRMLGVKNPQVGSDVPAAKDNSVASQMMAVYDKVKGIK